MVAVVPSSRFSVPKQDRERLQACSEEFSPQQQRRSRHETALFSARNWRVECGMVQPDDRREKGPKAAFLSCF